MIRPKNPNKTSVAVFCGAQNAVPKIHLDAGKTLGEWFAASKISLVYGGGNCGMMGAVANAVMDNKGWVTGVFPENLKEFEQEHEGLSESIIVDTMHTRKELMYKRSDMFCIMPGGMGTMDEFFEILTWKQLGLHDKPIVIFNHQGYWTNLIKMMESIITNGFAVAPTADMYDTVDTMEELQEYILERKLG